MNRFRAAGFHVDGIDCVVHTHVHADHVGWDTRPEAGEWMPTFTSARHLYTAAGLAWLREPGGYDNDAAATRLGTSRCGSNPPASAG